MKTLADLKRDVKNGKIRFEMIERYGKTGDDIVERCRGIRNIKSVNTVGFTLVNSEGEESEFSFPTAKLLEYDGNLLTIYERGERDLTEQEKSILEDWKMVEDRFYKGNPYGNSYWKRKEYFKNCPCPWLVGGETIKGKYYNYREKIIDNQVRGKAILKYKIYAEQ